jgi:septation ring formation regulator
MLLAHRLTFGNAEKQLEAQLDDVTNKFREFAEKTEQGDYLEAREVVLTIHAQLTSIKNKMELIPQLLIECQSIIPSQLSEVQEGYREMEGQGYYLDHLELEKEITQLEENLKNYHALIEETDVDQAGEGIKEVKERIDILFDLLEKEVLAKHFVLKNEKITSDILTDATNENENLSNEVAHVQQSYQLTDSDFEIQRNLERELSTVYKHYSILVEKLKMNETAQSAISEEVRDLKDQLDAIRDEQQSFALKLQALRKDELEAREKVTELTKKVGQALRLVTKSNIPGLPNDYKYLVEDANDSIQNVKYQLEEKPLTISALNQYLEIAVLTVEKLTNTTIELVENVMLAEKAIQYGNRYRSQYPSVAKGLLEAERAFRQFDYQEAIEQAAASIEGIDPEALKKIKATVAE